MSANEGFEAKFRDALKRSEFGYDTSGQGTEIVTICLQRRMNHIIETCGEPDVRFWDTEDEIPEVINIALFFGHFIDRMDEDTLYSTFCARFLDE